MHMRGYIDDVFYFKFKYSTLDLYLVIVNPLAHNFNFCVSPSVPPGEHRTAEIGFRAFDDFFNEEDVISKIFNFALQPIITKYICLRVYGEYWGERAYIYNAQICTRREESYPSQHKTAPA